MSIKDHLKSNLLASEPLHLDSLNPALVCGRLLHDRILIFWFLFDVTSAAQFINPSSRSVLRPTTFLKLQSPGHKNSINNNSRHSWSCQQPMWSTDFLICTPDVWL